MSCFGALEADQQATGPSRKESDTSAVTPQHQSKDEEWETAVPEAAGSFAVA